MDHILACYTQFVKKMAMQYYRFYGIDFDDLVSEGNFGLLKAIEHFDPNRGFRFSTYAIFWIKAYIRQYIMYSKSIVKRTRKKLLVLNECNKACVEYCEAVSNAFFTDVSIDQQRGEDDSRNILDCIPDERADFEEQAIQQDLSKKQKAIFQKAFEQLKSNEKEVIRRRHLISKPSTLENIAKDMKITAEGVRQMEKRALDKLQKEISKSNAPTTLAPDKKK
jgi:RNA polymerase sigma-32 factor